MRTRSTTVRLAAGLATLGFAVAACGSDDAEPSDEPAEGVADEPADSASDESSDEPAAEPTDESVEAVSIGIVAPSASNDLAFTQSIVDSVNRLAEDRDIEIAITDGSFVVEDAAASIRGYAEDGVDLVIAHGSQYGGPLQEIAPEFPDTAFAWGTSVDTFGLDNVFAYTTRADEGGYVNGVMAGLLTESNTIGVVGPIEVGDAKLYVDGFIAGAAASNPDATVNVNYIESFSDVALAAEAAAAHVTNGADVMTGTAQMVVGATGVAGENGIPWFGTQSDQTPLGDDFVVASQEYHWEVVLADILDSMSGGTMGGEAFTLTFANGGLEMIFNDGFELSDDARAAADEAIAALTDGSLSTGVE
ncbi:MAG: BMP family ABC transporter substrate-binding protein [Actinomycetota bacterium]